MKNMYFSYVSSDEERIDAEAANKNCGALGLKHTIYEIPTEYGVSYKQEACKRNRQGFSRLYTKIYE